MQKSLMELNSRTISKILSRMNVSCFVCGWNEAICDIHHIQPKAKGGSNDPSNLTVLCPNCHRIAHSKKKTSGFPTIEERIGESWREFYFVEGTKNTRVRQQIAEGMRKAHSEGRSHAWGRKYSKGTL